LRARAEAQRQESPLEALEPEQADRMHVLTTAPWRACLRRSNPSRPSACMCSPRRPLLPTGERPAGRSLARVGRSHVGRLRALPLAGSLH
jgi:hypothetical protein